jgi:hypothetical protein
LTDLPELPTYICAFSFRPCSAQAAVDVLRTCKGITPQFGSKGAKSR